MQNKTRPCVVHIVDDDDLVRNGLARLMRASGFVPRVYDSPETFLREVDAESPACILLGGETTVTLGDNPGKGGRNQEFVLAVLAKLGAQGMNGVAVLSGGTDGEDGPTDAAGAVADANTPLAGAEDHLTRHDAYHFFDRAGGLIKSGLTGTNVMDVRVILVV